MNANNLIKNTLGIVLALAIIFFVVVFIWFGCAGIKDHLKETLTLTISFFGGLATLSAACVAIYLFNDWRDQHNAGIKKALIDKTLDVCDLYEAKIFQSIEDISKAKAGYIREHSKDENDRNPSEYDSILNDNHAAFLWGRSMLAKHLIIIRSESSFNKDQEIKTIYDILKSKKKEISDIYIDIINSDDLQKKISGTNKLNELLAPYLAFINMEIYIPLSLLRFENKAGILSSDQSVHSNQEFNMEKS